MRRYDPLRAWWHENGPAVLAVLALLVLAAVMGMMQGCAKAEAKPQDPWPENGKRRVVMPNGTVIEAEPGATITATVKETAEGVGSGVTSDSKEVVASMDLSAPMASLDKATGGSISYAVELTGGSEGAVVVWIIGAVFLAVGAVIAYRGSVRLGLYVAACGPALVGCWVIAEQYPWLFLVAAAGCILALVAVAVWGVRLTSALGSVVTGVEMASGGVGEIVKENIAKVSDHRVKSTIRAVKAREGIA